MGEMTQPNPGSMVGYYFAVNTTIHSKRKEKKRKKNQDHQNLLARRSNYLEFKEFRKCWFSNPLLQVDCRSQPKQLIGIVSCSKSVVVVDQKQVDHMQLASRTRPKKHKIKTLQILDVQILHLTRFKVQTFWKLLIYVCEYKNLKN